MATKKKPQPRAAAAPKSRPEPAPTASAPAASAASAPMNREQRRRAKFGKAGKVHQHDPIGPWPESGINPALSTATGEQAAPADESVADAPDQAGPGSGGATEAADRKPRREGARPGNSTKG